MKFDLKQSSVTLAMAAMLLSTAPAARAEDLEEETISADTIKKEGEAELEEDAAARLGCKKKDEPKCDASERKYARCIDNKWHCAIHPRML